MRESTSTDARGGVDIWWDVIDSPVGPLAMARSDVGVVAIGWNHDQLRERLAARVSARLHHAPKRLVPERRQFDEYFEGKRRRFTIEIDWRLVSGFRRDVLERLAGVPFGEVVTYAQLAARAGRPRAVRAVGSAMAANPLPILIPCHRVVRTGGGLGGYSGPQGLDTKRWLLAHEGVEVGAL